jgi:DNA-binding beta-propeller fold protein YncE
MTHRVFSFNGGSANATAIDGASATIVGSVSLGGRPEFAVTDGKGRMFVNIEDRNEVVAFDTRTLKVAAHWPLVGGEGPSGIALDRKHRRLFSGCDNHKMIVLDADRGSVVATLPIGEGVDGVAFDPGTRLAFSSNGEGSLTVVREDAPNRFAVAENDSTQRGARTLALDEKTHRVFVVTAEFGPPPPPTAERPHPRASIVPGTFQVLVLSR